MLGIIFCSNIKHILIYSEKLIHPEQPGRVLTAQRDLTKKYPKNVVKVKEYEDKEVIEFIKKSGFSMDHIRLIEYGFFDINSAYAIREMSLRACINETKCLMTTADMMINGNLDYAINVVRPPGHHCCNTKPAGFCVINTAILSAQRLLTKFGKVVIFDVDLHHGGGTQKMMEHEDRIMYVSIHNKNVWSDGCYPKGINVNRGRIINVALPGGSDDDKYLQVTKGILPDMRKFGKVIILSLGFDAHKDEISVGDRPSHRMNLTSKYYEELGKILRDNFEKVYVVLEGGYNEKVISEGLSVLIENLDKKKEIK